MQPSGAPAGGAGGMRPGLGMPGGGVNRPTYAGPGDQGGAGGGMGPGGLPAGSTFSTGGLFPGSLGQGLGGGIGGMQNNQGLAGINGMGFAKAAMPGAGGMQFP